MVPIWLMAGCWWFTVMSLGLALMFTPLFTAGLGAVPPHLYSHGSAILGTIQQVGGAAGTALLVAVLSLQTAAKD